MTMTRGNLASSQPEKNLLSLMDFAACSFETMAVEALLKSFGELLGWHDSQASVIALIAASNEIP